MPRTKKNHIVDLTPNALGLLTEAQCAAMTGRGCSSLQQDRYAGRGLPYLKLVGQIRYRLADVQEWVNSQVIRPRNQAAE